MTGMDNYTGTISPPGMFVRALYDYEADDRTSLSFHQGEIIQVLTQLESGWWDGVVHGKRGWFPSNYCTVITSDEARELEEDGDFDTGRGEFEESSEGDYEDEDFAAGLQGHLQQLGSQRSHHGAQQDDQEAEFWIPQATPDGRLFYFNTLTGVTTMELPLESPSPSDANGSRGGSAFFGNGHSHSVQGSERDDTDADWSASENDDPSMVESFLNKNRQSQMSDTLGSNSRMPVTSRGGRTAHVTRSTITKSLSSLSFIEQSMPRIGTAKTSFINNRPEVRGPWPAPPKFVDDTHAVTLTWDRMVDDMKRSVDRYRQAFYRNDPCDFVQRAEDISDHLRLIIAAGSGTTDNHSGIPSSISSNKALYPPFRDMMSRFSKLVLSSHIAAADWSTGDTYSKCLQEADGVLQGVYGFVEVARQQRGEEIPRIFPGFVTGETFDGSDGFAPTHLPDIFSLSDSDWTESGPRPHIILDQTLLDSIKGQSILISSGLQRMQQIRDVSDRFVNQEQHMRISDQICSTCIDVFQTYRPWITNVQSIDLGLLEPYDHGNQLASFDSQRRDLFRVVAELVTSSQDVGAPLADEWAAQRGKSLEERLHYVRTVARDLDDLTTQVTQNVQIMHDMIPYNSRSRMETTDRSSSGKIPSVTTHKESGRSLLGDISHAAGLSDPRSNNASLFINAESSKVKKFFGSTPVIAPQSSREVEETPLYLKLDHEDEVLYETRANPPTIKGGTLTGLVEQLTRHDRFDSPFNNTFLLTYQSFTSAPVLFEQLVRRWSIQPPPGLTSDEYRVWAEKKQGPIRFRIVNVLKNWFDNYWLESNDAAMHLLQRVYNFARDTVTSSNTPGARQLLTVIEQRLRGEDTTGRRLVPNSNIEQPAPILPKNMKKLKFVDIDPTEFARQLTIMESRHYNKIKPYECLNKIWKKQIMPRDAEPAANVKALILHSNRLTNWVAEMILMQQDVRKRVNVIKHFISVADKCLAMHNFSTLTSILSAFGTAPIHRLNRTWSQVNAKTMAILEKMRRLMGSSKNFAEYRESLHQANPPCIPFFGVYLTDLVFIEDGIPSLVKGTELINFSKRARTAEVIREIQTYQNVSYSFKSIPEMQDYILNMMQSAGEVHEMYEKSLQVEPREREDEKIARLLSESGFL